MLILCSRCADIVFRERPAEVGWGAGSVPYSTGGAGVSLWECPACAEIRPAQDAVRPVPVS